MIEAHLHHGALVEFQVAIGEIASECSSSGTDPCANASALATSGRRAARCADSRSHGNGFDHVAVAHAFAFNLAFGIGLLDAMLTRESGKRRNQWHLAVAGIDLVKADQHAGMKALFNRTDVAGHALSAWNHGAIGPNQVFRELCLEMFSLLYFGSIEFVVETDQESRSLGNAVGWCGAIDVANITLRENRYPGKQNRETPNPTRPETAHVRTL